MRGGARISVAAGSVRATGSSRAPDRIDYTSPSTIRHASRDVDETTIPLQAYRLRDLRCITRNYSIRNVLSGASAGATDDAAAGLLRPAWPCSARGRFRRAGAPFSP
jgi:hypothetical protein